MGLGRVVGCLTEKAVYDPPSSVAAAGAGDTFPAGEGADQRMRREADEGYALRGPLKILRTTKRRNLFRQSKQKFFAEDEL